ncbi:MAG: hypothetical protein KME30_07040 [Iphinoe sp. HA4291-MV1]|jgi:uncharacterized membrane protein|nr:hypothetical protein [Iphinoe sp. HA4291-MV1]
MSILKRLPFFSLALLLLTYTTISWVISKAHIPQFMWLLAVISILCLMGGLTTSWTRLTNYSFVLFKSNLGSFGMTLVGAFLFFLMIVSFRVFVNTLLIVAVAVLARIDFQTAGFNQGQTFWFLSIFSLTGLALGAMLHKLI